MTIQTIRPIVFILTLVSIYFLQLWRPIFKNTQTNRKKTNIYIFIISSLFLKLILPLGMAGVILYFQKNSFYVFTLYKLPFWLDLLLTIVTFDFLIYWQHRFFHMFTPLWNIHKVHHSDHEMDLTTGLRFHPIEIALSAFYKVAFIYLLAPSVESYILYEIMLNSMAMFNHANLKINDKLDKLLRLFIVTPSMHYPHHDKSSELMNLNFGNTLSIWDRMFNTYTNKYMKQFGIYEISDTEACDLKCLIKMPVNSKNR